METITLKGDSSATPQNKAAVFRRASRLFDSDVELVEDSEDERERTRGAAVKYIAREIINISSDESDGDEEDDTDSSERNEDEDETKVNPLSESDNATHDRDVFIAPARTVGTATTSTKYATSSDSDDLVDLPLKQRPRSCSPAEALGRGLSRRKTTHLPDNDIIDLTTSSPERPSTPVEDVTAHPGDCSDSAGITTTPWNTNDGSILTLDEPRTARKPISAMRRPGKRKDRASIQYTSSSEDESENVVVGTGQPGPSRSSDVFYKRPSTRDADTKSPAVLRKKATGVKSPRVSKKAAEQAELARRQAYARQLFDDLNATVFKKQLPSSTQLIWSPRLLTTAGRAHWRKSSVGVETTEIQLATKILDCDERIRNTLSHEMCHLACWVIDRKPQEAHGSIFKGWASRVMRTRPDIEVSTKHNYDINYPFEWKCVNCSKVYGRYSNSIKPEEQVCGACKTGYLQPQFQTKRAKVPKTKADSRNAATTPRDSPNILGMLTDALSTLNLQGDASSVNTPTKISGKILASTLKATKTAKSRPPVDCDSDIEEIIFAVKRVGICE